MVAADCSEPKMVAADCSEQKMVRCRLQRAENQESEQIP